MKNEQVTLTTKKRGGTPVQQRYRKKGCQAVYVARTKKVFLHVKTKRRARALMNKWETSIKHLQSHLDLFVWDIQKENKSYLFLELLQVKWLVFIE